MQQGIVDKQNREEMARIREALDQLEGNRAPDVIDLDVSWASTELCKNFDKTENADMLAWLLIQIQCVAVKSEEDKQYGAAVGCYRLIYDLIFKDMK